MFKLLRYFSLTALVSLTLAAAVLSWLFVRAAESDLVSSAQRANGVHATIFANALHADLGEHIWRYLRDEAPRLTTEQLRVHPMTQRLHTVLGKLATGTSVVKVKLFSPRGITIYSSEAAQIGEDKHNVDLIYRAFDGEFASNLSQRESFVSFDGKIYNRSLVSTYIPAVEPGMKVPTAVFELYADLTPMKQALDRAYIRQFAIVISVMVALYLAQYLIVRHGAVIIRRQHESLEAAQREIERARQIAEAANAAKSRFLANMSHEIRTPLHGLLGIAELLERTRLDATQTRFTRTIARSGQTLLAILNDILDLSKIESGKLQLDTKPFDLHEIVTDVCTLWRPRADARALGFMVDIPAELPTGVKGDALRLQQVLYNLIGNAIKFTAKGAVTLTLRPGAAPGEYHFTVTDTGIGIAPDVAARLFVPFVQADSSTSRQFGGTGLGLAIAHQLVELMGGTLAVTSTPGAGSEFAFNIKLVPCPDAQAFATEATDRDADSAAQIEPTAAASPALPSIATGSRLPVLLVEDNAVNILIAEALLHEMNLRVTVATNGVQAIEAVRREQFGLILMDCHMPVMDGPTATPLIREAESRLGRSPTPIVAMTASAMADEREHYRDAGMDDFLAKPFSIGTLRDLVQRWCPPVPFPTDMR